MQRVQRNLLPCPFQWKNDLECCQWHVSWITYPWTLISKCILRFRIINNWERSVRVEQSEKQLAQFIPFLLVLIISIKSSIFFDILRLSQLSLGPRLGANSLATVTRCTHMKLQKFRSKCHGWNRDILPWEPGSMEAIRHQRICRSASHSIDLILLVCSEKQYIEFRCVRSQHSSSEQRRAKDTAINRKLVGNWQRKIHAAACSGLSSDSRDYFAQTWVSFK